MAVPDPNSLFQQQMNFVSSLPSTSSGLSGLTSFLSNPAVGTIANVGSSLLGSILNLFGIGDSNEAALRAMREQNQWAYKMWKESNEYNSPSSQMARLRAAGINPALAYANGIQNTANAVSETASPAQQKAFQMPVNPISIDPLSMSQANLINAQAEDARASAKLKETQLPLAQQQLLESQRRIDEMQQNINESLKRIELLDEQKKSEIAKTASVQLHDMLDQAAHYAAMDEIASRIGLNDAQAAQARALARHTNRLTHELVVSAVDRLAGIKLDNKMKSSDIAKGVKELRLLGIEVENGMVTKKEIQASSDLELRKLGIRSSSDAQVYQELVFDYISRLISGSINASIR